MLKHYQQVHSKLNNQPKTVQLITPKNLQKPSTKNIIDVNSLKEDHKEFIIILKTQHRFGSEKHNALRNKSIRLFSVQRMIK